jgi:PAS domain-containing protein
VLRTGLDDEATLNPSHLRRRLSDLTASPGELPTRIGAAACLLLARLDLAVVLFRPDRSVQFANPAALRLAARGDCFRIRRLRVLLTDRKEQARLEMFLNNRTTHGPSQYGPRSIPCREGGSHGYILHAEWLDAPTQGARAMVSLRVYEPFRTERLSPEFLGALYGLTRMESRLAASLFETPALQTAADHCGIGLNTAKTHLKQVFIKCSVCSKAQLLRVLALGPQSH